MQSTKIFSKIITAGLNTAEIKIMDLILEYEHRYCDWCLKDRGRTQEPNLSVSEKYALIEQYVAESDGVLVFASAHSKNDELILTEEICDKYDRPVFFYYLDRIVLIDHFDQEKREMAICIPPYQSFENLVRWGRQNNVLTLYITAPRASLSKHDIAYRALWDYVVSILNTPS